MPNVFNGESIIEPSDFSKRWFAKTRVHQTESKQKSTGLLIFTISVVLWELKICPIPDFASLNMTGNLKTTHILCGQIYPAAHLSIKLHHRTAVTIVFRDLILEPQCVNNESTLTHCLALLEYGLFVLHSSGISFKVTSETRQPANQRLFPSRTTQTTLPPPSFHASMCSINNK